MTRHHGKDRIASTPARPPEPGMNHQPTLGDPDSAQPEPPPGNASVSWWLVLVVWILAAAVLWGSEIIRLVYRMFNATPPV